MREFLDGVFSSLIIMTTIFCVVMFLFVGLSFLNPFRNKKLNIAFKASMYVCAFLFFMLPTFSYYGYAKSFDKLSIGTTTLALCESYDRGGEGPSENVTRLHIIDKTTGKRKDRKYIGAYGQLLGMRNDTLCYLEEKSLVCYDAANMKEIYRIEKDQWPQVSTEFQMGISDLRSNQNTDALKKARVELDVKNGKSYCFDPYSKTICTNNDNNYLAGFSETKYQLSIETAPGKSLYYMTTASTGNGKLHKINPIGNGNKYFNGQDPDLYIDPFLLCIDTIQQFFVYGYFPSTDQNTFIIEAKDFHYKLLWKKTREDLHGADDEKEPRVNVWKYSEGLLYFNSAGFIVTIEPLTGNIHWKTRL